MNYDIHVYWSNKDQREEAVEIRNKLISLKVPSFNMVDVPIGPHPLPMFEAHANDNNLESIVDEIEKVRKGCSILIHKKTGNHMIDHTIDLKWLGDPLSLNLDFIAKIMGH